MTVLCRRFLFLAVAAVALFASCSDFNSPVKDYLEEYAGNAAIGYQQFLVPVEKDADGIDSIASDADGVIRFLLRNPRSYVISTDITMDSGEPVNQDEHYLIQQSEDLQSLTLTFTESFLRTYDKGGNISARLDLRDPSPFGRIFPSWHFNLRSNTPPPVPSGSRVMVEQSNNYVLCFNLDLRNEVQDDIASIQVNDDIFTITDFEAGTPPTLIFSSSSKPLSSASMSTKPPEGGLSPVGNLQPFVADDVMTKVYLRTNITQSQAESRFTITVRDAKGLSRTAVTSTAGNMLARPTIVNSDNNTPANGELSLTPDLNGDYSVTLSHAEQGVTLKWKINNEPTQTTSSSGITITITDDCTIEAWASKSGYIDSEHVIVELHCVTNVFYVDPTNIDARDEDGYGSQSRPYKTITYAVTQFSESDNEENTIYLMGDITSAESSSTEAAIDIRPAENFYCVIEGYIGNEKITVNKLRGMYVLTQSSRMRLILRNLTIRDCFAAHTLTDGGGIYFSSDVAGSSLTLQGCTIHNNQVGKISIISRGGGIYCTGADVFIESSVIRRSTITNNKNSYASSGYGGGIYISEGTLTISGTSERPTEISGNTACREGNGYGGGICIENGDMDTGEYVSIQANYAASYSSGTVYGYGGGIAMISKTRDGILTVADATISGNYANRNTNNGDGFGGGIYTETSIANTVQLELSETKITSNFASDTYRGGAGGGIYAKNNVDLDLTNTTITGNTASSKHLGTGGGIYIIAEESGADASLEIVGGDISSNYASKANATHIGYGGALFLSGKVAVSLSDNVTIANNVASMNTQGHGGGIYLTGTEDNYITFTLNSCIIDNNKASKNNTGQGGAFYVGPCTSVTSSSSDVQVINNKATESVNASHEGFGGAFFVSENGTVTWSGGTMTGNCGNTQTAAASYGEAFNITGSATDAATVNLGVGLGANNGTSGNVIHMTQGAALHLQPSVTYRSDNYIYHNGGKIYCEGYLYSDTIPLRVLGNYGDTVLDTQNQRAQANYYKFKIGAGTTECINASGTYSKIESLTAISFGTLVSYANSAPTSGMTRRIICNFSLVNVGNVNDTISIPTGTHIRIIPSGAVTINPWGGKLISIQNNGHLLIGQLLTSERITFDCNVDGVRRTSELIEINGDGSLVLHNTLVKNSFMSISGTYFAPLINQKGGANCVVLDDFMYSQANQTICSNRAAFILSVNAKLHFISGGITNFRAQTGPGVAELETGSTFYLYPGVTLTGNSVDGLGNSISGSGTLDNPSHIPLN